jgi:hypothetical protein
MATLFNLGGLLGINDGLGDLLTPEQQRAVQQRGLLSAAAALLQAGGRSTTPISLGQAIGSALTAGQTGAEQAQQSALTQMLTRQKVEEARRAKDLQDRIGRLLTPTAAAPSATITPEMALAAPVTEEMPAGPTVARAEMIGQTAPAAPAMSQSEMRAQQYRQIADIYAAAGKGEDAKRYMDIAEQLAPARRDLRTITVDGKTQVVDFSQIAPGTVFGTGRDIRPITVDGKTQFVDISTIAPGTVLGTGRDLRTITVDGKTQVVDFSTVAPGTTFGSGRDIVFQNVDGRTVAIDRSTVEPGATFGTGRDLRLVTVDGKTQVVDLSAVAPGTTFGTGRDIRPVDVGGRIQFVDFSSVAPGTTLGKSLAPQVVGGAESGFFVVGGGGGGAAPRPAAGAPAPARPPAAAGAPVAPAPAAAPAAAAPAAAAPAPAAAPALPPGLVPLIPGTGPKPTEDQSKSAGFAFRMGQATQTINSPFIDPRTNEPVRDASGKALTLEDIFGKPSRTQAILRAIPSAGATTGIANYFEDQGRQLYRQAQENWVSANLRAESGAVIGEQELDREIKKYFPQVDDKPETIRQKADARRGTELAMQVRSGPSFANIQRAAAAGTPMPRGRLVRDRNGVTRYVEE